MRALKAQEIMARISVATPESPIAIFRNPDATYDARFAGPVLTHLDIARRPHNLVGVYHSGSDQNEILAKMGYQKPHRRNRDKVTKWNRDVVRA